ncbi:hypothetical protein ACO0OL_001078 [Hanseniaspora opuntiae]|jgi:hypothetical protein|uniref:Large ribosomal subunit protein mL40 n=1 Tax=Hanseniaspora opuntiae TaxID=211096 RepID=A0A1E5R9K2_9ASCO|nr:54S ribosomal protein L28, mitochondrial [Hanseniaspora opuntiae]
MLKKTFEKVPNATKKKSKLQIQVDNLFNDNIRRGDLLSTSLNKEDYLKHRMIERYRTLHLNKQHLARQEQLEKQYGSMKEAMDAMQRLYPDLHAQSHNDKNKRFPVEYRVPTEHPPTKVWEYDYLGNKKIVDESK